MLELEAMRLDRVATEVSAQYVDHNLIQEDFRNPDDHLFLGSACQRFGVHFSRAGNGVSHAVHMERFGKPLLGSDSHTPAAGAMGILAIGAGGLEVAMAGKPFYTTMPEIWGVELTGALPDWVSAKQGRDPGNAAPSRRGRRCGSHHRVPRSGPACPPWTAT